MRRTSTGFTALELLIGVTIVGILGALALQAYGRHMLRAGRLDATNALLAIAQAEARRHAQFGTYSDDLATLGVPATARGFYALAVESDGRTFTATATALGPQRDDRDCASFWIDHTGERGAEDAEHGERGADCWR